MARLKRAAGDFLTMPLGRYRGRPFEAVPRHYLEWIAAQPWPRAELRNAVERELARREAHPDDEVEP